MWQRRTLSTPLVRHVQVHMYRNLTYFTVVVLLVKFTANLLYGKKFFQKADEFFKGRGKFV